MTKDLKLRLSAECFSIDSKGNILVDKNVIDSIINRPGQTHRSDGEDGASRLDALRCWAI
jgi:hypothetical protein